MIGCTQVEQADGTLEQVNGSSLVIQTASGQPVTVTTTAATFVSMSGALLGDITDGASVMVRGYSSGGTIAAAIVTVGQPFSAVNPAGFVPIQGTVADVSTTGFTLVTSTGARVPVTTSGDTLVVVPHASPGQLPAGITIFAVGRAGPDGTLAAQAVAAVSQLRSGPHLRVSVRVKDCSPSSIIEALGAISVGARPRQLIRPTPMVAGDTMSRSGLLRSPMNGKTGGNRGPRRAAALAVVAAAAVLTACGGSPSSSGGSAPAGSAIYRADLAYAHCMQTHGVPGFPDPNPSERLQHQRAPRRQQPPGAG